MADAHSQRTSMPNLKSVRLKTKESVRFHFGCRGMKISLISNRNVARAARDPVPTSKKPLPFTNDMLYGFGVRFLASPLK